MSTLGSMARAAEYAAAKAANARKVSRETEEQKLPPKATPVSLGAFTKGQPTSRNKGNKTWKPLTAEDLGVYEDYSDNPISTSREHTPFCTDTDDELHETRRLLSKAAHVNTEELKVPTAPKAMLVQRDRPAVLLNPAPRRVPSHPVINFPPPNQQMPRGSPDRGIQGRSLLNVPHYPNRSRAPRRAYLHDMQALGARADQSDNLPIPQMFANDIPAEFLTPTRDEIAEVMRERERQHMENMQIVSMPQGPTQQGPPFGVFDDSPLRYYNPAGYYPSGYSEIQPNYEITPPSYYHVQQTTSHSDLPPAYQVTPPTYQAPRNNVNPPSVLYHPEYRKPDFPYDRARMMENYKATLTKEALERKGKTVLHNPELHKLQNQLSSDIVDIAKDHGTDVAPWQEVEHMLEESKRDQEAMAAPKKGVGKTHDAYKGAETRLQEDCFAGSADASKVALKGPPPGLGMPTDGSGDLTGNCLKDFPDYFYTLKPMTMMDVRRVQAESQRARDDLAGTVKRPLNSTKDGERVNERRAREAKEWFYGATKSENPVSSDLLAAKMHESAIKDKALREKGEQEMNTERAIISNVIKNVSYYFEEARKPEGERTVLHKYAPVPEYARERPSIQTGGSSIFSSFFEESLNKGEAKETFIPTPNRIARDPRFRLAAPPGLVSKAARSKIETGVGGWGGV